MAQGRPEVVDAPNPPTPTSCPPPSTRSTTYPPCNWRSWKTRSEGTGPASPASNRTRWPRAYEISDPDTWTGLVEDYPIDASASLGGNWRLITQQPDPWLIPDWASVAANYDAVHLTTLGSLSTAGQALQTAGAGPSSLAGNRTSPSGASS